MLNNGTNNPMNVRPYAKNKKWLGQIGVRKGFCVFSDERYSFRVACYLIMWSYRRARCYSVSQIINRYAPPIENPTMNYEAFVCKHTGLLPNDIPKTIYDVASICEAMYWFENGLIPDDLFNSRYDYIVQLIKDFGLKFYYA